MNNSNNRVGIYTRISVEENIKSLADSIANQKSMLIDYVNKQGFDLVQIYEDEGEKGGNYERPAFKKMLKDIENEIINCVVVKDLSRLGREYIETGKYIEKFFPKHNIRFISVLENIDSYANPERMHDIDIPIINIFNNKALNAYTKYKGIKVLDRKTAVSLIKLITIDSDNSINIKFKFEDEIKKYQRNL